MDRRIDGKFRPDYPKPESETRALRQVLRSVNADVVALQEIGDGYLEELQLDLKTEGLNYPYAHLLVAADPVRHVAVLSKKSFSNVREHTGLRFPYFDEGQIVARGLLELSVRLENLEITFFVLHLKSRFTSRADDPESAIQRAGEAVKVRNRVLERFPDPSRRAFFIMGDFNDLRPSRPLRAIESRGKTRIARWLFAADSRGETWTHYYARNLVYSRVDHILASPMAEKFVRRVWIPDMPEVMMASDHRPVLMEITSR